MKKFISYLSDYTRSLHSGIIIPSVIFIAATIFLNYQFRLNEKIDNLSPVESWLTWSGLFTIVFSFSYILLALVKKEFSPGMHFFFLLIAASALFAVKMAFPVKWDLSSDHLVNGFYNAVLYFPVKLLIILSSLWVLWICCDRDQPFYGSSIKNFDPKPYFLMLLVMIPLIAIASMQDDFNSMYPKLTHLEYFSKGKGTAWQKLLYEISYGMDFISIEFFFRGFLVLAFIKWAGKDAILPMAMFYCTIHFGKPLGECVSSFFGGIVLGVITYHTGTIWGGLIVHLGIAWMMELFGMLVS